MSAPSAIRGLSEVPIHELDALSRALAGGRVALPVNELSLRAEGLHELLTHVDLLARFGDAAALGAVLELLRDAQTRRAERGRAQVVWSGPEPFEGRARQTSVVLQQLFESAEREVFIAGYAFDEGEALLRPLHAAMLERGVSVEIVLDGSREKIYAPSSPEQVLDKVVDRFFAKVWTFGAPQPALFHDPRTLVRKASHYGGEMFPPVSMHAKCVVVDRRYVLVGSANFTRRGHATNIEVGALLDDVGFADGLLFQWRAVMGHGFVVGIDTKVQS